MSSFLERLAGGAFQAGCFVKTPAVEVIELIGLGGLDCVCLDAEHAPLGRRELDLSLAVARAVGLPALVRVSGAAPEPLLQALDGGAVGVLVPHVASAAIARDVARWSRYGEGGRGYAGSTRAAGFASKPMSAVLAAPDARPLVFAQIEDPAALREIDAILAVDGIAGAFFGAADMAVGMGLSAPSEPKVAAAFARVARACDDAGKPLAAFAGSPDDAERLRAAGVALAFLGSDQSFVLAGARAVRDAAARLNARPGGDP